MNKNPKVNQQTNLKQLNFKVQPDFYWKLKNFASSKRFKMAEVLEKAFKFYEKREQVINEINTYRQGIKEVEQQMQPFQGSMGWAELELKMNGLSHIPFNQIGLINTYQVLKIILKECLKFGRK